MPSAHDKAVANPFYSNDLNCRIMLEISAKFGNIYIEIAAVKKRIAAP